MRAISRTSRCPITCFTVPVETSPPSIHPDRATSRVAPRNLGNSGEANFSWPGILFGDLESEVFISPQSYAWHLCAAPSRLYDCRAESKAPQALSLLGQASL